VIRLRSVVPLLLVGGFAVATCLALPSGLQAGRLVAAELADDPTRLCDLQLDKIFNAEVASREVEAALAGGDPELAESFVELARDRAIALDPSLITRVDAARQQEASLGSSAMSFVRGLVTGQPDNVAAFAGTATGDLFVFGDIRDALREGAHLVEGVTADKFVLGLSLAGIAITAGTYASAGAAAPARVGLSLVKAARRSGRIGERLVRALRLERTEGLVRVAEDVGTIEAKAGTRAALEGLKLAEQPKDLSRFARLSAAKGGKTRAIVKLLGRGAIALTATMADVTLWILWALFVAIGFVMSLKRSVERTTQRIIRHRKTKHRRARPVVEVTRERAERLAQVERERMPEPPAPIQQISSAPSADDSKPLADRQRERERLLAEVEQRCKQLVTRGSAAG